MLMRKTMATSLFLLAVFVKAGFGFTSISDDLMFVTDDFPPYAFVEKGHIYGIAADIVNELMNRAGYDGKIIMLPWSRAQKYSEYYKMMLFPYVRVPYREKYFKWIGPIMKDCFVVAVPGSNKQIFTDINEFKTLRVGVNDGSPMFVRLKALGFKSLQVVPSEKLNAKKLVIGKRIDAWFAPYLILKHTLESAGIDANKIRIAFRDQDVDMYIGASLNVSEETIALWQANFEKMKVDGTYQRIVNTACLN